MKHTLTYTALALVLAMPAMAAPLGPTSTDPVLKQVADLKTQWAHIKYQIADKDTRLKAIAQLEADAASLVKANPDRPEPKIWEGIILSTDAGISKSLSALGKLKQAKALLEDSLKADPAALDGSAHTSLGALYYQVPVWPVSFGDNQKAETELKAALAIAPAGRDTNYFYGDYLLKQKRYAEARTYLEKASSVAAEGAFPVAEAGRQKDIAADLALLAGKERK